MGFEKKAIIITVAIFVIPIVAIAYLYTDSSSDVFFQPDKAEVAIIPTTTDISLEPTVLQMVNDLPPELKDIAVSLSSLKQAMKQLEQNELDREIEKANAMVTEMDKLISQADVKQIGYEDKGHTAAIAIENIDNLRAKTLNQETALDEINSQQ